MRKMKKIGIIVAFLVVALSISICTMSSASALTLEEIWEANFGPIFDGNAFNDTVETDVSEEQEEIEKDWLESDERIFPPGWANVTPKEEWTDKPANWFNETPREDYNLKPDGYWDVNTGLF